MPSTRYFNLAWHYTYTSQISPSAPLPDEGAEVDVHTFLTTPEEVEAADTEPFEEATYAVFGVAHAGAPDTTVSTCPLLPTGSLVAPDVYVSKSPAVVRVVPDK